MKKMLLFVLAVLALVAMPSTVSAQYRGSYDPRGQMLINAINGSDCRYTTACGPNGRSNYPGQYPGSYNQYGYYDPAYIQQMMSLPESLAACQVDFSTGRVVSCRPIVKEMGAIQAYLQNPEGTILGTVHIEKKKWHFRPFDDTNHRIGTGTGGVLGAGGGAVIGGATGGLKGAAIGAVGGGILGGLLGSKKSHDNCLIIEPMMVQSAGLSASNAPTQAPTSNQEQVPTRQTLPSVAEPVKVTPELKLLRNKFEYNGQNVRVRQGTKVIVELKPGDETEVELVPGQEVWFEVFIENKKSPAKKWGWTVIHEGEGVYKLPAGWEFGDPTTRPTL